MTIAKPYVCHRKNCRKQYTTRFSLRRHLATHVEERKFACPKCPKKFSLAQYLKEHSYIHEDQKPFLCDYVGCNARFRQAGKLSMHKKSFQHDIFLITKHRRTEKSSIKIPVADPNALIKPTQSLLKTYYPSDTVIRLQGFRSYNHEDKVPPQQNSPGVASTNFSQAQFQANVSSTPADLKLNRVCVPTQYFSGSNSGTDNSSTPQTKNLQTFIASLPEPSLGRILPMPLKQSGQSISSQLQKGRWELALQPFPLVSSTNHFSPVSTTPVQVSKENQFSFELPSFYYKHLTASLLQL